MGALATHQRRRVSQGEIPLRAAELMLSRVVAARHVWPTLTQMRVGLALGGALPMELLMPETQISPPLAPRRNFSCQAPV